MPKPKQNDTKISGPGYIVLDRAIMSHWIAKDPVRFQRWIDMIMLANYKAKEVQVKYEVRWCERGQFITTHKALYERWHCTKQNVRSFLKLLQKSHMINVVGDPNCTHITICNYDTYQLGQHTTNTLPNTQPNTLPTHKQQTSNPQVTTTNKGKNEKKDKKDKNFKKDIIIIINELNAFLKSNKKEPLPGGAAEQLIARAKKEVQLPETTLDEYNALSPLILQCQAKINPAANVIEMPYPEVTALLNYHEADLPDLQAELMQSDQWHTEVCLKLKGMDNIDITPEYVKQKIPDFINNLLEIEKFPVTLSEKKIHFRRWIRLEIKEPKNEQSVAKKYTGRKDDRRAIAPIDTPDDYGEL